jgi:(hydroxyamino)benzene mutase
MQRGLFRNGFWVLLVSLLLGVVAAATSSRQWLGAHTTGLLDGVLVVAAGAVWPSLRLSARGQRIAYYGMVSSAWVGVVVPGIFATLVGFPLKIVEHGTGHPPAWAAAIVGVGLAYITLSVLTATALIAVGLRGDE